jgi:hypothetical protein
MLNNVRFNGKTPPTFHIYKVSDEQAGMKQVRSMYLNGRMVYNYRPCEKLELNARK